MEDRIKIGDVWYRKEEKLTAKALKPFDIIHSQEMQITVDDCVLIASVLGKGDKLAMPVIDKKTIDENTLLESMDNEDWLLSVANRDVNDMDLLNDNNPEVSRAIIALCDEMKKLKWI